MNSLFCVYMNNLDSIRIISRYLRQDFWERSLRFRGNLSWHGKSSQSNHIVFSSDIAVSTNSFANVQ